MIHQPKISHNAKNPRLTYYKPQKRNRKGVWVGGEKNYAASVRKKKVGGVLKIYLVVSLDNSKIIQTMVRYPHPLLLLTLSPLSLFPPFLPIYLSIYLFKHNSSPITSSTHMEGAFWNFFKLLQFLVSIENVSFNG